MPVSNIDGSETTPIILDDGTEKVITLGRYTFSTSSPGTPTIVQKGSNTSLMNTGSTGDEKCKIFDMAGNEKEWTTEYCTYTGRV